MAGTPAFLVRGENSVLAVTSETRILQKLVAKRVAGLSTSCSITQHAVARGLLEVTSLFRVLTAFFAIARVRALFCTLGLVREWSTEK